MDVENLAVSKISSIIGACPHLKAYITSNDRTPFTDGYIELYDHIGQTKESWRGKVPVQVKGRTRYAKSGTGLKHPISRTDLEGYQRDSGVLYFVVAVDPASAKTTPYYAMLSPVKIDWLLHSQPATKKTIAVAFKAFPEDPKQVEPIVGLAHKTRDQNAALRFDPDLFDHLQSITIHTATGVDFNRPVLLSPEESDFALVVTTRGGMSLSIAGSLEISPLEYAQRTVEMRVESNGVSFDSMLVKRISDDVAEARVPGGLAIEFGEGDGELSIAVKLSPEGTLSERIKSIEFYLGVIETSAITIGRQPGLLAGTPEGDNDRLRRYLASLSGLKRLFEVLDVDDSLVDLDAITEEQAKTLRVLQRGFVDQQELPDKALTVSRVIQPVGKWNLVFLVLPGLETGKWRLVDMFNPDSRQQFSWLADGVSEEQRIRVTSFDVVDEDILPTVLNLRLDTIVKAYEDISVFTESKTLANREVLRLISAADAMLARRDEFLTAAVELNEWLVRVEGENPINLINRWQIRARTEGLTPGDRKAIRSLNREAVQGGVDNSDWVEVACAILLEDEETTTELLERLSPERAATLEKWPLWALWQRRS